MKTISDVSEIRGNTMNNRWKPLSELNIPPIKHQGFAEDVIIRDIWKSEPETIRRVKGCLIRKKTGEKKYISEGCIVVGKSIEADYQIVGNNAISRRHARILRDGETFAIEDLSSKNHTYVSEEMINGRKELTDGDVIRLANEGFVFEIKAELVKA